MPVRIRQEVHALPRGDGRIAMSCCSRKIHFVTLVPAQALRPARSALHSFGRFNFLTIVCCRDTCKGVRQCECEICVVKLRERWGRAPRDRLSGAGPKPFQAAAVKSRGGERWSESSRKTLGR